MLIVAVLLCSVDWHRFGVCFRRYGQRFGLSLLPVLLFILGGYISIAERDVANAGNHGLWHFRGSGNYMLTRDASFRRQAGDLIRQIMDQDHLVALIGGKLVRQEPSMLAPVERISSAELARLYWREEVATANNIGRNILIAGTVLSVQREAPAQVTLELPGFASLRVLAELQNGSAEYVASLQEGKGMEVYCSSYGRDGGSETASLYLSGCAEIDVVLDAWAYSDHLMEASRGWQDWFGLLAQNGHSLLSLR